jgi:hypothetical protein
MFLAIGESSARVFLLSSDRPNDSTVGVISCLVEVEASCLTLATGVEGVGAGAASTGAEVVMVVAAAAVLAVLDSLFFWLFVR